MSRLGKRPVDVPSGVKVAVNGGLINFEGPKGKLSLKLGTGIAAKMDDGKVLIEALDGTAQSKANHGTTWAMVRNHLTGVSTGWKRVLELSGVGYRANVNGQILNLSVGLSHEVKFDLPQGVKASVEKNTVITLEASDRQLLGNLASRIRKVRPPEPYLGKGIKFAEETVRRKAGKTGKK